MLQPNEIHLHIIGKHKLSSNCNEYNGIVLASFRNIEEAYQQGKEGQNLVHQPNTREMEANFIIIFACYLFYILIFIIELLPLLLGLCFTNSKTNKIHQQQLSSSSWSNRRHKQMENFRIRKTKSLPSFQQKNQICHNEKNISSFLLHSSSSSNVSLSM